MNEFKSDSSCLILWDELYKKYKSSIYLPNNDLVDVSIDYPLNDVDKLDLCISIDEGNYDFEGSRPSYMNPFPQIGPNVQIIGSGVIKRVKKSKFSGFLKFRWDYLKHFENQRLLNFYGINHEFPVNINENISKKTVGFREVYETVYELFIDYKKK